MPMVEDSRWWVVTRLVYHLILMAFALLCIIPMVAVLSVSFSDEIAVVKKGYGLLPRGATLNHATRDLLS